MKLLDFKNIHKYISSYQAAFEKIVGFLTKKSHHIRKSTEMYFQAIILRNIGPKYLALVSAIEKDWEDETTKLVEAVLQIIRYFEFMESTEKGKFVFQTSISKPTSAALKGFCKNLKYIKKGSTTHYTNWCWIEHLELK